MSRSILTAEEIEMYDIDISKFREIRCSLLQSGNKLVLVISIPNLTKDTASQLTLVPVPNENNEEIVIPERNILHYKNKTYVDKGTRNIKQLEETSQCTKNLVGKSYEYCKKTINTNYVIEEITVNTLLITNAKNASLKGNCNNQTLVLNKNYIIRYSNCTLQIDDVKWSNKEITSKYETIIPNYAKPTNVKLSVNLDQIHIKQIENIEKITKISSKIKINQLLTYLILTSVTMILITCLILYFVKHKVVKVKVLKNSRKNGFNDIRENAGLNGGGIISLNGISI